MIAPRQGIMDVIAARGLCPRLYLLGTPAFGCVARSSWSCVGSSVRPLEPYARFIIRPAGWLPESLGRLVTIGQGRDDMAMEKNVSHPGGLPSRTSNSSDCKWG